MKPQALEAKQTADTINILNIGLMVLSAFLAYAWPFYLFLIAYAVLGPLHYLTEISWLHDRHYFSGKRQDALLLLLIGLLFGATVIAGCPLTAVLPNLIVVAFLGAIVLTRTHSWLARAVLLVASSLFIWLVPVGFTTVVSGMLLLTIVHVFVFTGCFILFGAMKSASRTGYVSFAVFLSLAALLLLYRSLPAEGVADSFVVKHYIGGFGDLNLLILRFFNLSPAGANASDPFEFSPGAVAVMRFIAFAYVYHYLNWFSKTKIIGWYEVSKTRLAGVVVLWLGAVTIYLIDYDLGLKLLFTLSALHVLLEFPLDIKTVVGLASHTLRRLA